MRIDKFLSNMGVATRTESSRAARAGLILVNGKPVKKADVHIDPEKDMITYCGRKIEYRKYTYILMNKPDGVVSATEDGRDRTVIDLLPEELQRLSLFPCGRLDKHTLGLVMLTDDGDLAHRLLSPKHHVKKKYRFESKFPLSDEEIEYLEKGATLEDGYVTKPSRIELFEDKRSGYITLIEGKYHQIKRMLESVNNKITYLERITFGPLALDENLARGEWRFLTHNEIDELEKHK
ncbi:MAG: rRNA pseudouridine synthase [Clostridia bacterium]|nr:rRNA pseudouridine synthase [Clostridia bacterium]